MTLLDFALILGHLVMAPTTAIHALLYKRDPRSALGWVTVCVLFPLIGPFVYYFFGINRVRTRARQLTGKKPRPLRVGFERGAIALPGPEGDEIPSLDLDEIGARATGRAVTAGNRVQVLYDGEQAYPPMVGAIEAARERVVLCSYIFDSDATGCEFVAALKGAVERGVDVKVLVDGIGERYSRPRISKLLRRSEVPVARFIPPRLIPPALHVNLRTHRKILVVDGRLGFTGGMNIGGRHVCAHGAEYPDVRDTHFSVEGPEAAQLETVFLDDWDFATGARTPRPSLPQWPVKPGAAYCRVITDGPDDNLDRLTAILHGILTAARKTIVIVTPYFLPSREMIAVLQAAALRGVSVRIILPGKNNLPYVHWATQNLLWELLGYGIDVCYQPAPFNHSKLLLVDTQYALVGSANLDPRSLRLNFELGLEIFDPPFVEDLAERVEQICAVSRPLTLEEVDARSLPVRLRDAFFWLFSPYL